MLKKISYIFILFLTFFIFINKASALTCSDIQEKIIKYDQYTEQLEDFLDCTDNTNLENVNLCNTFNLERNAIVEDIMQFDKNGSKCASEDSKIQQIIDENSNRCSLVVGTEFDNFVNTVMIIFYILGPVLLIIFGSIDYARAVAANDEASLKKANKPFVKRLIATILLFLSPVIVNVIVNFNISDYDLTATSYSCEYNRLVYNPKINIKSLEIRRNTSSNNINRNSSGNASIGGQEVDGYVIFRQGDPQWGSDNLLGSSSTIAAQGCALSSVAMQIVNSGVETVEPINPGSLSRILRENGQYGCSSGACIVWGGTTYATNGKFVGHGNLGEALTGDINEKAEQLSRYLSEGYYPVLQVKGYTGGEHYVAVFKVENGNIYVGDPAPGEYLILNDTNYDIANYSYSTTDFELYRVED